VDRSIFKLFGAHVDVLLLFGQHLWLPTVVQEVSDAAANRSVLGNSSGALLK
jgi:hypothetical protein